MNRRTRTLIVVAVAVVLASLASIGVYRAIRAIPVREVPIATNFAVVAKENVPVGVLLNGEQVKVVPWPADSPIPGSFTKVEDVVGRGVVVAMAPNEPVLETKLSPKDSIGGLPPLIPPGMRAMAVRVNDVIGVAGFTIAGTRVDVIVTIESGAGGDKISRAVLSNIQVLTAGTNFDSQKAREGQAQPNPGVVTLLVTPADGERLALAQTLGQIVLSLRNPMDVVATETAGARVNSLIGAPAPAPVKQVVKGQTRMVAPAPPPPPPPPYTVETIRGAKRSEVIIKK